MRQERGFSLLELLVVAAVVVIVMGLAIPHLIQSRIAANEGSAIASVRSIGSSQALYWSTDGRNEYADSLAELLNGGFLDPVLASGYKDGFDFQIDRAGDGQSFTVLATPSSSFNGRRSFFLDEFGVIHWERDAVADPNSPVLGK